MAKTGSRFALDILLMPNWQVGPPTQEQWARWHDRYRIWLWGWIHLYIGTVGDYWNDDIWEFLVQNNSTKLDIRDIMNKAGHARYRSFLNEFAG